MSQGIEPTQHIRIGIADVAELLHVELGFGEEPPESVFFQVRIIALKRKQFLVATQMPLEVEDLGIDMP